METPPVPPAAPLRLDPRQAFRAMLRFTPFSNEKPSGEPELPLLLGILLGCAQEPYGFLNPSGRPTGCGHGGSMCAPTLGNSAAQFFTTERVRRVLLTVRQGVANSRVREVLQEHLALVAPQGAPNNSWVCVAGWFKRRMLECVFAPVPEALLYGEPVGLDNLLARLAPDSHGD